jgi:hypothetical protein
LSKLLDNLFKQNKAHAWLGGVKHSMGQIGIYVSFINLILLMITSYNTGWIQKYAIGLNFMQFAGIIAGIILVALIFEFKVDMPNYFSFWNQQNWRHDNPMRISMEELHNEIATLKKEIGELKDANKTLHS